MGIGDKSKTSSAMTVEQLEKQQAKATNQPTDSKSQSPQAGEPTIIINNNNNLSDNVGSNPNLSEIGVSTVSGTFPVTGYVIPTQGESSEPASQNTKGQYSLSGYDDATLVFCISYLIARGYKVESPSSEVKAGSLAALINSKKDAIFKIVTAPAANIINMIDGIRELF